jgi:hypothetical protein
MGRTAVLLDFVVGLELKTAAVEGTYARVHADTLLVTHNLVKRFFGAKKFSESTPRRRKRKKKKQRKKKKLGGGRGKSLKKRRRKNHHAVPRSSFEEPHSSPPRGIKKHFFGRATPKPAC